MGDFRLPFSAGAESSSVSFDPRRQPVAQQAPVDDEVTQVTQSGGRPVLDVGATIQAQFGATSPAVAKGDNFTQGLKQAQKNYDANARSVPKEVAQAQEKGYVAKRRVWGDINKKKLDQTRAKNTAALQTLNKGKAEKRMAERARAQTFSKNAQAKRRQSADRLLTLDKARTITKDGIKKDVAANNTKVDVKTVDTKVTDIKVNDPGFDPKKQPL